MSHEGQQQEASAQPEGRSDLHDLPSGRTSGGQVPAASRQRVEWYEGPKREAVVMVHEPYDSEGPVYGGWGKPVQMFKQGTVKRYHRLTPIGEIFELCPPHWRDIPAGVVWERSQQINALLAVVLQATYGEQIIFLQATYDEFYPDDDVLTAFDAIVHRDRLIEVLDWKSAEARERIVLVYLGVRAGRRLK